MLRAVLSVLLLGRFLVCPAAAQSGIAVAGTVTDASGQPVIGASVMVEGTTRGAVTDLDGNYSLSGLADTDVLEFSSIGYASQSVQVRAQKRIDVILEEDNNFLDEVVVVGYGTTTRKHIVSSIASVNSEALADRPVANVQQALQGAAANLVIQTSNFDPTNSGMNISIRGVSTMGSNTPLVVIDGVPQADASRMNDLNPNDIESINILKDAGSSAIYGARSSNGVILITTKQGKREKAPEVRFSAQAGVQNPHILYQAVPSWQNAILRNEALTNVGYDPVFTIEDIESFKAHGDCVPFMRQAMKNALQQNYSLSVTGGTAHTTYMVSGSFFNQNSNYVGPKYGNDRYNVRTALTTEWGRFKLGANVSYTRAETLSPVIGGLFFADMVRFPTYWFLRTVDENGIFYSNNYKYGSPGTVLADLMAGGSNKYDNEYLTGTFNLDIEIIEGLKFRGVLSAESRNEHRFTDKHAYLVGTDDGPNWSSPSQAVRGGNITTPADEWTGRSTYFNTQLLLDFNRTFAKVHSVNALLGWSQESNKYYGMSVAKSYLNDLNQPSSDTVIDESTSLSSQNNSASALRSFFGRVGYSYADRYYVEFTARYDMSSKFLKVRNAGFFPAVSLGWRASDEPFMAGYKAACGDLKLRASYGLNGNQQDVGLYDFMTTYGIWSNAYAFNGKAVSGLMFTMGNEALTWEKARTFNVGLDASFFKNALNVNFDWFYKRTSDILLPSIVTGMFGASIAKENRGIMDNTGWELTVSYDLVHGDFTHNFSFNLADSMNKVIKYGTPAIHSVDGVTVLTMEGLPLNSYYGYKTDGYFSTYEEILHSAVPATIDRTELRPGDVKYVDINADGVINEADRTYLGYGFPRYTFGFQYGFKWKGLDVSFMLQGVLKRTSAVRGELFEPFHVDWGTTMYTHQLDYWAPDNPSARWPRLTAFGSVSQVNNWGQPGSQLNMLEGAYMRVKNIQVGYTLPKKWTTKFYCQSLRIFFDCQNPLTLTKYSFIDPESTEFGSNMGRGGANSARNYPTLRYFGGGINIVF